MNSIRVPITIAQLQYRSGGKGRKKRLKWVNIKKHGFTIHLTGRKDTWAAQKAIWQSRMMGPNGEVIMQVTK